MSTDPDITPDEASQSDESPADLSAAATATNEAIQQTVAPDDWQMKAREYLAGWQRAQADYQNLQKETAGRIQSSITYATESFLQELLPIIDHFDYAFQSIPEAEQSSSYVEGMKHIYSNFLKILADNGVIVLDVVGKPFDSSIAEAVEEVEATDDHPSGTVVAQISGGFKLHDKVIRCAKVKVAK